MALFKVVNQRRRPLHRAPVPDHPWVERNQSSVPQPQTRDLSECSFFWGDQPSMVAFSCLHQHRPTEDDKICGWLGVEHLRLRQKRGQPHLKWIWDGPRKGLKFSTQCSQERRLGRALDAQSNLSATVQVVGKPYLSPGDTLFYVQLVSQLGLCGCRYIESPPHNKSGADPKIGHAH